MADDYTTVWKLLEGEYPGLPGTRAQGIVNQAWRDICDSGPWSWLRTEGQLILPGVISAGSVTVVQGSLSVVADATATSALNAVALALPPLAGTLGVGRQIRVGAGPFYSITAWDSGSSTLTLDRTYAEPSGASQPYSVFKAYYSQPDPSGDFLKYQTILNPLVGYAIWGPRLTKDQEWLNARDPQRGSTGDPYYVVSYRVDSGGLPVHELWPTPSNAYGLVAEYDHKGVDLSSSVSLPGTLSRDVLVARSNVWASDWAAKNVGRFPELRGPNWLQMKQSAQADYKDQLSRARRKDEAVMVKGLIRRAGELGFPVDGSWLQSHAPWGPQG